MARNTRVAKIAGCKCSRKASQELRERQAEACLYGKPAPQSKPFICTCRADSESKRKQARIATAVKQETARVAKIATPAPTLKIVEAKPAMQAPTSKMLEELRFYQQRYHSKISLKQGRERIEKERIRERKRIQEQQDKEEKRLIRERDDYLRIEARRKGTLTQNWNHNSR